MKSYIVAVVSTAIWASAAFGGSAGSCIAQRSTEFALEYAEPLLSFERTCGSRIGGVGINNMVTTTTLSDPQKTATVKPNVDTLYSSQCFDVSSQNVELDVPEVKDRFWSVSFYSPEGDNYINFGSTNGGEAGKYLIAPASSPEIMGKHIKSPDPQYKGLLHVTNTVGFLLVRLLVKDSGPDLAIVNAIQRGFSTRLVNRTIPMRIGPEMNKELFANATGPETRPEHILTLGSRFVDTLPRYLGQHGNKSRCGTEAKLARAGVLGYGVVTKPACVNLTSAYEVASSKIGTYMSRTAIDVGNGWQLPPPGAIGQYGKSFVARASIARWAYLALTPDVALYPSYKTMFSLQSNDSYLVRFSRKPVLKKLGFWSITLYDASGYLVKNPIGRYGIGDRSNLTFADGTPLSQEGKDGPFEILVQGSEPKTNWTSNWLPSPQNSTSFELVLRFFEAEAAMTDGTWAYPLLIKQPASSK